MCDRCKNTDPDGDDNSNAREGVQKTELREVKTGQNPTRSDTVGLVARVAKQAALEAISEEVKLYQQLIHEAQGDNAKVALIDRLAALKLRSVGIVLGSMRLAQNDIRPMAPNKIREG